MISWRISMITVNYHGGQAREYPMNKNRFQIQETIESLWQENPTATSMIITLVKKVVAVDRRM